MSPPFFAFRTALVAVCFAATGTAGLAEGPTNISGKTSSVAGMDTIDQASKRDRHDPAKMRARFAQRQIELKARLGITPAQETVWSRFTASMQPPANMPHAHPNADERAAFDGLGTPERIDKMRQMRNQRAAEMNAIFDQRSDATKALYVALSAEQQKLFDNEHRKIAWHHGRAGNRD